jgi:hypothetical protein
LDGWLPGWQGGWFPGLLIGCFFVGALVAGQFGGLTC